MELSAYFKSILDEDKSAVVICDTEHTIIYMNPAALERYEKRGGASLVGKNLLDCHNEQSRDMIRKTVEWFRKDSANGRVYTFSNEKENKDVYMIPLRDESGALIGYYEKHEYRTHETRKPYDFM